MRIFALELNNDIKGIAERKTYIEGILMQIENPDMIFLPEMALCSYMASQAAWKYADDCGKDTITWTMEMAAKYHTMIGVGYIDREDGDYYNRYMIADEKTVYGIVSKSEGEAAVFKRGWFDNIIKTPMGNIAVGICYDAKRKHFYDNIKDCTVSLIVFPHGCPANPEKEKEEIAANDFFCNTYVRAFGVPVIYVNSVGILEYMPGKMGDLMKKAHFAMNGRSKIYTEAGTEIPCELKEVIGMNIDLVQKQRRHDIKFHGKDLIKSNWLFRQFVLKPDVKMGIELYQRSIKKNT